MSRTVYAVLLLLALAPAALAQPSVDSSTGLQPGGDGISKDQLFDYLRAVESATTTIVWDTSGDSRREFGANRMVFDLKWAWDDRRGEPVVIGGEVRPAGGSKSFMIGDTEVYKLKINRKGEIKVEKPGIDTTVYKITKKANGDIKLHIPWLHDVFAETTIPAETFGPFEITNWPPSLDEVMRTIAARSAEKDPNDTTRHEGTFRWHLNGRARPHRFPVRGGAVAGATTFDIRGAGRLEPNGSFRTLSNGNSASLTVNVGGTRYARDNGTVATDIRSGEGSFNGSYAITIPGGDAERMVMTVDGDVNYSIDGRNMTINVPEGARIVSGRAQLSGNGRLVAGFRPSGGDIRLENGTYTMGLSGPLSVTGLRVGNLTVDDLAFDSAELHSSGTVDRLDSTGIRATGDWNGVIEGNARGAANVLLGEDGGHLRATLGSGTRGELDLDDVVLEGRFRGEDGRPSFSAEGNGTIRGAVEVENGSARLGDATLHAPSATTTFELDVEGSTANGITNATGAIDTVLNDDARLVYDRPAGRPSTPTIPEPELAPEPELVDEDDGLPEMVPVVIDSFRRHTVVRGDSLSKIARDYGVSLADLRKANGMGRNDSLIRINDVLKIPGTTTVMRPVSNPAPARPAAPRVQPQPESRPSGPFVAETTVEAGSALNLDVDEATLNRDGLAARGFISSTVRIKSADLRSGDLEGKILGAARASLARTRFDFREEDGSYRFKVDDLRVPVRIDLSAGASIKTAEGAMDVVIDRDGSYAEFTAHVTSGPDGKLKLTSLEKADLLLHSNGAARFAGRVADVAGEKTIRYTGRMVFVDRGIDFYGDISVTVRGSDETPAVRIRW